MFAFNVVNEEIDRQSLKSIKICTQTQQTNSYCMVWKGYKWPKNSEYSVYYTQNEMQNTNRFE